MAKLLRRPKVSVSKITQKIKLFYTCSRFPGESLDLPDEILVNILLRVPAKPLARFKTVSKLWHRLITNLTRLFTSDMILKIAVPTEIHKDLEYTHFLMNFYEDKGIVRVEKSPLLQDQIGTTERVHFLASCNDLLLIQSENYSQQVYVYNSTSRRCKRLPPPPNVGRHWILVHEATSKNIRSSLCARMKRYAFIPWTIRKTNVLAQGELHWLAEHPWVDNDLHICVMDIAKEEFHRIPGPITGYTSNSCLSERNGSLYVTAPNPTGDMLDIWVLEDKLRGGVWVKDYTIALATIYKKPAFLDSFFPCTFHAFGTDISKIVIQHNNKLFSYDLMSRELKLIFSGADGYDFNDNEDGIGIDEAIGVGARNVSVQKKGASKKGRPKAESMYKIRVDTISNKCELSRQASEGNAQEKTPQADDVVTPLPQKFKFGVEVSLPKEKTDYEKYIDGWWGEFDFALKSCEMGSFNSTVKEDNNEPEIETDQRTLCHRGKHLLILDEEIGIKCSFCSFVKPDIKYVQPPLIPCQSGRTSMNINTDDWDFSTLDRFRRIELDKLVKNTSSDGVGGHVISHAPGTGKTLLTIAFLMTYMEVYKECRPIIIAPCSMLLTWGEEFRKWKVNVPFHNLNSSEYSGKEHHLALELARKHRGKKWTRLIKLYSWSKGKGILGISYPLFERLAGRRPGEAKEAKSQRDIQRFKQEEDVALNSFRLNPNEGVKTRFLMELIRLSQTLNKKVLVFSQFIDPFILIKDQLQSLFNWTEGKEVLQMDGKQNVKIRQQNINLFNDPTSQAKVLLALGMP
ncbi:hypothetical protein GIB67_004518 [Kingdonia uniflora]|uniref:F-box domain-containing protein n=1 Tax=Kingdonia uniflora TaxID=39325 RepID=A0A7J7NK74_9MAGN|nr:hypothetical protein GIB67_004518 [Kingdonia uniflora]